VLLGQIFEESGAHTHSEQQAKFVSVKCYFICIFYCELTI